ncbi:alpha/beta fold hydrolase [Renibacterium salmoninarum]|uniref:alpha/beta fold hydrolase n=1 Tax=Renibacterium salmoninarum TaxID=1646 RepID=UPI0018F4A502|nr:alpha/beta fold hydrolase [Renibacterium salmoninarum]
MEIILIAGLWLDASAWRDVVPELEKWGHRVTPLTLPGQGDGQVTATFADQRAAVISAVDAAKGKPLVVGHSAACTLAWIAADARPEKVAATVLIGGFPSDDAELYADFFEMRNGEMLFPGWQQFEGPDSADLDAETRAQMTAAAIPIPEAVARGVVQLEDPRRFDVPTLCAVPGIFTRAGNGMGQIWRCSRAG